MRIRTLIASAAVVAAPLAGVGVATAAQAATSPSAAAAPVLSGGHATATTNRATVTWKCTNASTFKVTIFGPGKINGRVAVVHVTKAVYSGLESGHTYNVKVQPLVNGKAAGKPGIVTFKTRLRVPGGAGARRGRGGPAARSGIASCRRSGCWA